MKNFHVFTTSNVRSHKVYPDNDNERLFAVLNNGVSIVFYKKDLSLHNRCGDYSPWAIFQSSNVDVICHALHQLLYGRGVDTQVRCQLGIGDARIVTHQSGDASVSVLERVDAAVAIAIY